MSSNMKSALLACATMLPILLGVAWFADILTRDFVGAMMLSHGGDPASVMKQSILAEVWAALILMWLFASGIVLLLAKAGLGDTQRLHMAPPPLPPRE